MAKNLLDWLYRLLVVNTLDSIHEIDSLVEGLIVSTFGILFGLGGYFIFRFFEWGFSAEVSLLAFYAYAAVFLYHFVGYWREKKYKEGKYIKKGLKWGRIIIALVLTLFVYLWILNQALYIAQIFPLAKVEFGSLLLFLRSLPGLLVLFIPLAAWEELCKYTPVDEIVKWWFK